MPLGWGRRLIRPAVCPGAQLEGLGDATQVQGFRCATVANERNIGPEVLAVGRQGLREKTRRERLEKDSGDMENTYKRYYRIA